MFVDAVILQAIARRFHRCVDDEMLDRCALESGCAPVGRLCLLDDDALAGVVKRCDIRPGTRLLDAGCGRGFLARWLRAARLDVEYFGIDRIPEAVRAAHGRVVRETITLGDFRTMHLQVEFDAVVALEVAIDGLFDAAVLDAAASALKVRGNAVFTLASLDGRHAARRESLTARAKERFEAVELEDWTMRVAPFARRTYEWWLSAAWHPDIAGKCRLEANAVLKSIERGDFQYAVLFARK